MPIDTFDSGSVNTVVGTPTLIVAISVALPGLYLLRIDRDAQQAGDTFDVWAAGPTIGGTPGIIHSEQFVDNPVLPEPSIPQIGPVLLSGDEDAGTDTSWMIEQTGGSARAIPWTLYRIYEA